MLLVRLSFGPHTWPLMPSPLLPWSHAGKYCGPLGLTILDKVYHQPSLRELCLLVPVLAKDRYCRDSHMGKSPRLRVC